MLSEPWAYCLLMVKKIQSLRPPKFASYLPDSLRKRLKVEAAQRGVPMHSLLAEAVEKVTAK